MFKQNTQHLQTSMFGTIDSLPPKKRERLEASWAGTFYNEVFARIDEDLFAVLYSSEPSRPNIPVNVLAGLEILKSGFGWDDEEMYDSFCYNVQVRYALGYRDLAEGHFELRTIYNFRKRVTQHMQETGVNLFEKVFEQITDEQIVAHKLKTDKLRMDSTLIASNIRAMSRLQLLVEVLQRVHRMLNESDQQQYADDFAPYLKGSSGQYIYHIKGEKAIEHIQQIGQLMHKLVRALPATYADDAACEMLQQIFEEHFDVEEDTLRPKAGKELSAGSLQSPDDQDATYRQKREKGHVGYASNLTETCNPENDLQLIVKVQTESNNTDDAAMLAQALPELKERTDVDQMHTDGGYNSPAVDTIMRQQQVEQIQTAIRGRKPSKEKLGLDDFEWETNAHSQPQTVTCPHGQQVDVAPGRKKHLYRAAFAAADCEGCPFSEQCPTKPLKRVPERVLRFSQQKIDLALRRKRSAATRAGKQNLRAAVEATVRSVKHPFRNGKLPVRGSPRVSMVIIGSAAMSNARRIHRYLASQKTASEEKREAQSREKGTTRQLDSSLCVSFWTRLRGCLCLANAFRPSVACGF